MVMNPARCAMLAAVAVVLTAPFGAIGEEGGDATGAAPAERVSDSAAGTQQAQALLREGRLVEALDLLRSLAQGPEVDADVVFLIGLAAVELSRQPGVPAAAREALLDEAIAAFRFMLINRPELVRVRLELARAFFLKGEDDLSREQFERVLAGNPPAPVVANVRSFLAEIRARRRWTLRGGFALAPDTNIGATSEERIIYISGLPFVRDAEELSTSGIGLSAWLSGEYQYPLGDRRRLRAGADVSRRDYAGSTFDQTFVSVHGGPRWLIGANAEASLLASVQRRWTAGGQLYDALGARLEAGRRITRRVTANAWVSYHDRGYRTQTHLDGPVADLTLGGAWVVSSTVRADAAVGWGAGAPGPGAVAPQAAVASAGIDGGAAPGVHRGRQRRGALDGLRRELVPAHHRGGAARGPDPFVPPLCPQPGLRLAGLQPAPVGGPRSARHQRTALRL